MIQVIDSNNFNMGFQILLIFYNRDSIQRLIKSIENISIKRKILINKIKEYKYCNSRMKENYNQMMK